MDISNNCSLYPLNSIINKRGGLLSHIEYTRGICELDRSVSIVIDLADFLGIVPVLNKDELIVLQVSVPNGDFALIIPAPKMTRSDIQFEEGNDKIKSSNSKIPLISSNYVILDNEIYLKVDVEQLSNFIGNEISSYLTQEWNDSVQNISFENNDNLAKIIERSFISKKTNSSIIESKHTRNNIILCNVGNYQFSFSEKYISELKYFNQIITPVPDTPEWVNGAIDYQNDSLPLVDLGVWLGIESSKHNDKLLVIIEKEKSIFGFLCDSVSTMEKPENVPVQHFESINIEGLPFRNITYNDEKYIFSLNIDTLAYSIISGASLNSMQEWNNWKAFLNQNTNEVHDRLKNKSVDFDNLNLLNEFVEINFQQISILLDLGDNLTFFTHQTGTKIKQYPHYCDGLVELSGNPSLVIDLAKYLGISHSEVEETLLIKILNRNNSIALKVPIPKVVRYNIDSNSTIILDNNNNQALNIPSSQYYIIEGRVYLKFDQETIFKFLKNELQDYLSLGWENALPNWDSLNPDTLVKMEKIQTKIMNYAPKLAIPSSLQSNNLLICKIHDNYFAIKEDAIIQVISTEMKVTNIPDSPLWIHGVMDYQNKDIVVLDLSELLQLPKENESKQIIVVTSTSTGPIAFQCSSVYHLSNQNLLSINEFDLIYSNLPYTNVYNVEGRTIFHLNMDYLQNSIKERRDMLVDNDWSKLLSVNIKTYQKHQTKSVKDQIYRNNSLSVRIGNDNYTIPLDDIVTIRSVNENESISSNDLNLIAFSNNWIPSVTIGDPYESEVRHKISLILKCEDFVFELQGDELRLVELGRQLITSSTWDTLMGGTSPIGLKTPFHTETGLAFGLNLNDLLMNTYGSLLNKDTSLTDFINELSLDPPRLIEESTVLSKQMSNIWDEDTELFLIIIDANGNTKSALNTNLIVNITLEIDPKMEISLWENSKPESYFYITTATVDDYQKALQIPADCYLLGVGKESINSDDRFTYVTFEDEKIPILEINNKV